VAGRLGGSLGAVRSRLGNLEHLLQEAKLFSKI